MKAALIIIGDEILNGRVQDTNSKVCATQLLTQGITLSEIAVIGDSFEEISSSLKRLIPSYDLIITSGGLGPTMDDKTKEAIARFLQTELVNSKHAVNIAKENYKRKKVNFDPTKNHYHIFPKGLTALNNPKGLAPGIFYKNDKFVIACAPGVPIEFDFMLKEEIIALFLNEVKTPLKAKELYSIRTMGIPEEKIFGQIDPHLWDNLSTFGKVSSLPQINGVDIVVSLNDNLSLKNDGAKIENILRKSPLWTSIWQLKDQTIEKTIVDYMIKNNLTLATAESCTGGLVSHKVTNIKGASQVLLGGAICYSIQSKINILSIDESIITKYGVVSKEVAACMCESSAKINNTDYAISLTGVAGPGGGSDLNPVGTVYIGIKCPVGTKTYHFVMRGDREKLKERFATKALFLLLQTFQNS